MIGQRNEPSVAFNFVMLQLCLRESQGGSKVAEPGAAGQSKQHKACRPVGGKALNGLIG